ncbi:hypothetical protein GF339_00815, partial [candidate division KSB3 bacterium]|nr:hypothetical protein [candidate division KSB3 bacterium]MBD3323090.1 hypothetical protein [candidate division KSB3 bacterium]
EAAQWYGKHLVEFFDTQKDRFKNFDRVKQAIYQIVTSPQEMVTEEFNLLAPVKTLKITGNPVLGEKKAVIGHMIALHDITQEKQLEQMRDDFISMIVHDLKNPLAAIIGFAEIMAERAKKQRISDFERFLTGTLEQANTLHEMVNNILEVHKMEDGSMEIQKNIAKLDEIIMQAVRQVEVSAKQRDIAIHTDLPPHLPAVFVDQTKMIRLFANILSNGIKYTPENGTITVRAHVQDEHILASIADTGKGIPADYLDTIFDRFAQLDRKQHGKSASVGLGLYFCKLVVESHGGEIWAESEEGQGSTFYFTIPNLLGGKPDLEPEPE